MDIIVKDKLYAILLKVEVFDCIEVIKSCCKCSE